MRERSGYTIYPAKLAKQTRKEISRAGASLVCNKLVKLGILQPVKRRSPTWSKTTPHYSLREDGNAFIKLVQHYFQTLAKSNPFSWQSGAGIFMGSQYARRQVNPVLIREILSAKKVEMPLYVKVGTEIKNQEVIFEHFRDSIPISFPIMPPNATIEEMSSKVTMHDDKLTDHQTQVIPNIIEKHYREIEEKTLILPILALLQISPSALEFFLSDWKPYIRDDGVVFFASSQGFDMIEHVLFRLVWGAVNDLSLIRSVPDMGNVFRAEISGGNTRSDNSTPLLRVMCHDHLLFEYEAGFDTDHLIYGDELVEVMTNPENCRVQIKWRKENGPQTTS